MDLAAFLVVLVELVFSHFASEGLYGICLCLPLIRYSDQLKQVTKTFSTHVRTYFGRTAT